MLSHQEVVKAVIVQRDIHDGFWTLNIHFNVAATHGANVPDPCVAVTIKSIGIMPATPDDPLAIDAATFNPPAPAPLEPVAPTAAAVHPATDVQNGGMQFCRDVYRSVAVQSAPRAPAKIA